MYRRRILRFFDLGLLLLDLAQEGSHRLEQFLDALAGYRRDGKDGVTAVLQLRCERLKILPRLRDIGLVERDEHRFGQQVFLVGVQLGIHRLEVLQRIAPFESTGGVKHVDEDFGAPNMAQELESESDALGRAADEPRDVRHHKDLPVSATDLDDAQDRFQRRKRVVRDLGSGC